MPQSLPLAPNLPPVRRRRAITLTLLSVLTAVAGAWVEPGQASVLPPVNRGAAAKAVPAASPVPAAAKASARLRPFRGEVSELSAKTRRRMKGSSWHHGCPVGLGELREISVSYVDFHKRPRQGRLIVRDSHAGELVSVFRRLYEQRFRIRRIEPIDRYGGDDHKSMDADNTSAFNCRFVNGTSHWSRHAYGEAVDINPRENPYVTSSGFVSPPAGAPFADRDDVRKGMVERDRVIKIFERVAGFEWGGDWSGTKDYQHFSADGR
jgi:hypothetical protein